MHKINNTPFIDALEYGIQHINEGKSYNETIAYLKGKGWNHVETASFKTWFYNSFFCEGYLNGGSDVGVAEEKVLRFIHTTTQYDDYKCILKGDAYFAYLDFIEVQKAFESAESSKETAKWALYVTIAVGLAQILIAIWPYLWFSCK